MKKIFCYPYNRLSASVKLLAYKKIKFRNSSFRPGPNKMVINWGSSSCPHESLNMSSAVRVAVDKLRAFILLKERGVSVPEFTTEKEVASGWQKIVARTLLRASGGRGIVITNRTIDPTSIIPDAPLFVKYIKKSAEYRIHVVSGQVIASQRKVLKSGTDTTTVNWDVRNLANGFVYQRLGIEVPDRVKEEAIKAVAALGLDFGAVDIIWNEWRQMPYVLEVNTAPGIEGSTVTEYKTAFELEANKQLS